MNRASCLPLLLLLSLFNNRYSSAQEVSKKPTNHTVSQPLPTDGSAPSTPTYKAEAFIGTWQWTSGSEVFQLTISRNRGYRLPNGNTLHVLLGKHSYTRNGTLVESSYSPHPAAPRGWSVLGTPDADWIISLGFIDLTNQKRGEARLTIDPANPGELLFKLRPVETVSVGNSASPPPGFTIPTTMTLTRVP